jgi:transposase
MKSLEVINPKAAGVDVGSEKFHVSIAGEEPVVFQTFTHDVFLLRDYLVREAVQTVAMEATGVYWLYLYEVLEAAGLEVVMVNGRAVRNVPGRKTDMADCQWIATLHAHGLLRGGFVPSEDIRRLQDYMRLRADHVMGAASQVQRMQKALERMNIKFHDVISDLTGVSGQKVIAAIMAGERDPERLVGLCDEQIKKKKGDRVIESLRGTWRAEHLFALGQAVAAWKFYQGLLAECDLEVAGILKGLAEQSSPADPGGAATAPPAGIKRLSKNAPQIGDLNQLLKRICGGRDVTAVAGIADGLLVQLIAETGTDLKSWPTEKAFSSWLGLSPGTAQSGKRKRSVRRNANRAGRLFCPGARSLARSVDKALGGFFRRLKKAKGGLVAIKAVARKIALLYYRTLKHGLAYVEAGLRKYEIQYQESQRRLLGKLAAKQGFTLLSIEAQKLHGKIPTVSQTPTVT